ncbi:HPr family phosphocarrier protein [Enterobacteriaceae endosymbiont of Macroplea appendiculata]|uniref:HPr family phosphocarrier protein n=1 Tax=Enterobacteriaceae endosymbiont of Macroplea appendiculata TaxID=2675790 RepID=UPI00144A1FF1|nr:HPr family phosphocarrier protein [Enterobacteriaceae endosymbiont of Macroplea appendiculata]QJC31001.1 HPr family phosphocarrier protein [Enterobacteriaceae endosymbiont of Macroplea appendiculata]
MLQKEVIISNEHGLHTRPAALFVKEAKNFISEITITSNNVTVNAKSLFKIQTLGLSKGTVIMLTASGIDEKQAIIHLVHIIKNL